MKSAFAEAFQVLKVVFTAIERNANRFLFKTVVRSIKNIFNVVVVFVGYYFFLLPLKGIQMLSLFRVYLLDCKSCSNLGLFICRIKSWSIDYHLKQPNFIFKLAVLYLVLQNKSEISVNNIYNIYSSAGDEWCIFTTNDINYSFLNRLVSFFELTSKKYRCFLKISIIIDF